MSLPRVCDGEDGDTASPSSPSSRKTWQVIMGFIYIFDVPITMWIIKLRWLTPHHKKCVGVEVRVAGWVEWVAGGGWWMGGVTILAHGSFLVREVMLPR